MSNLAYWIPLFPLIGVLVNTFLTRRSSEKLIGWFASAMIGVSFLVTLTILTEFLGMDPEGRRREVELFTWIAAGKFQASAAFLLDPLSLLMMMVVTGVSFLIHIYSIGYMHGDEAFRRYFVYLNLFVFFMLLLVMGNNYLLMFVGWEGVGLCSYLLIGFWYTDEAKATAGKKAFIVNRIGDFGFLLAIFMIWTTFGTVQFSEIIPMTGAFSAGSGVITAICLLLFMGAVGKSAQFPLYVWLPDAMAGPTPVSALIHAATMVTAGVYMVARSHFLFSMAPAALNVVAWIGAGTALFAASIGLVQNDIKKVLAYSTVSQLGYMFLACGVGAYAAGIFHLMTHAFFKGLLFLGSGSVIHAMSGEQDIRQMGGLKSKLPVTYPTFLVATLAISGVPALSGFFSKDEILWRSFEGEHYVLWGIGLVAALFTAFYMFRLLYLTFFGKFRGPKNVEAHIHESPRTMTIPLVLLAILSAVGGYIGLPHILGGADWFGSWLEPVMREGESLAVVVHEASAGTEYVVMSFSILVALAGIWLAHSWYIGKSTTAQALSQTGGYRLLLNKYYVDQVYDRFISKPLVKSAEFFAHSVDAGMIDGFINGIASFFSGLGGIARRLQTGIVQNYAVYMGIGIIAVISVFLYAIWA